MLWGTERLSSAPTYKPVLDVELYPWQEHVLSTGLAQDEDGQYLARSVGVSIARQNGKTTIMHERAMRAVLSGERVISTSRDLGKAHKLWQAGLNWMLAERPDHVVEKSKVRGAAYFLVTGGGRWAALAPEEDSFRGETCDILLVDEARVHKDDLTGGFGPLIIKSPNRQLWMFSNACKTPTGLWWRRYRAALELYGGEVRGLQGNQAWFEFGAPVGADLEDREVWQAANPGMSEDELGYIDGERASMPADAWATEYLNRWPDEQSLVRWVSKEAWEAARGTERPEPVAVGADIDLTTGEASWAAAGKGEDGVVHLLDAGYSSVGGIPWLATELAGKDLPGVISARLVGFTDTMEAATQADEQRAHTAFSAGINTGRIQHHLQEGDVQKAIIGCDPEYSAGGTRVLDNPAVTASTLAVWHADKVMVAKPFLDLVVA